MKVRVFNKQKADKKEEVFLMLVSSGSESVDVVACDSNGKRLEQGLLLNVSSKGVYFYTSIDGSIGFDCKANGALKTASC